uniref:Uncharacterized protein n=1 Tax=Meloidogyne enterolobii TaxID=390850 RepID=A0A6V7UMX6_MELEN|nr:unnamed protein product [Meloidogyne enterolobii]
MNKCSSFQKYITRECDKHYQISGLCFSVYLPNDDLFGRCSWFNNAVLKERILD